VDTISVSVGGNTVATVNNAGLALGETKEYTVDGFTVPGTLTGLTDFNVSVAAPSETDLSDNAFTLPIGYTDLAVSATRLLVAGDDFANVIINNLSGIETDATLRITAGAPGGEVLYEESLESIGGGETQSFLVDLTALPGGAETDTYYFAAEADKDELLTIDNTALVYTGMGAEQSYGLTVLAGEGGTAGTVGGDSDGQYYAGEEIEISATEDPGYVFDGWTSENGGEFADASLKNTVFTMPDGDTTITANFSGLPYTLGDVNNDTFINIADVTLAYQHYRKKIELTGNDFLAANVNNIDTVVNIADVTYIYQFYRKKITAFPASGQ
jgi:uncharacterized repeat protein (TIGR02543 family)